MKRKLTTEISTRKLNEMKKQMALESLNIEHLTREVVRLKSRVHDFVEEVEFWRDATRRLLEESLL